MTASKRLAVLVASLAQGGIGKIRLHLMHEFLEQGMEVDLLEADDESPYAARIDPRVHVVRLPTSHAITGVPALVRYLRQRRPDAMLTQRIRVNVLALRARRLARAETAVYSTLNTNLSAQFASLAPGKARRQLAKLRRYYPLNDGLIAVSHGVARDAASLIGIPADSIRVIYNPVVTPRLFSLASEPLEHAWFDDAQTPVILGVGRLEPQKNFASLIEAFAIVRRQRPCRLVILGEGKLRGALAEQVRGLGLEADVELPGFVDNPYKYMSRASLFALSSSWEGIANSLVEALALGTPAVATDCPDGPAEVLDHGRYGPLVPVNDAAALADAMLRTLAEPLPQAGLREAAERFDAVSNARRYLEAMRLT